MVGFSSKVKSFRLYISHLLQFTKSERFLYTILIRTTQSGHSYVQHKRVIGIPTVIFFPTLYLKLFVPFFCSYAYCACQRNVTNPLPPIFFLNVFSVCIMFQKHVFALDFTFIFSCSNLTAYFRGALKRGPCTCMQR